MVGIAVETALLTQMIRELARVLRVLVYGWIVAIGRLIGLIVERCRAHRQREQLGDRERKSARSPCVPIDRPEMKRPDPLIYSQYYLWSLGLAVTWDNPDIELQRDGKRVSSNELEVDTTYDVVARIWNASTDAPAIQMPVRFSYLSFGAGTVSHPIDSTHVTVGVKGSPDMPAFASVKWTTPHEQGHYCIQVLLEPVDDLNYFNNLGQENTNVGEAHSPAVFDFELRNDTRHTHRYRLQTDAYVLPRLRPCSEMPREPNDDRRRKLLSAHAANAYPVPAGWIVDVSPDVVSLAAGASANIHVVITPPAGFKGTRPFNVNAIRDDEVFAGGVTLSVVVGP